MNIQAHKVQPGLQGFPNIKNIIAVASGKGGVGKSTVSANLALSLKKLGYQVGLLDADIYGPSQPHIMGSYENPTSSDQKSIEPLVLHGIQMISIGNLVDQNSAMIWRGPMVSGALMQLIKDTRWQDLDLLIIDLPPGTGDIQLTLSKKIPVVGAVVVTTPQDLAMIDAKRAISMFAKVNIPILGVIENMSTYTCPHCSQESSIFGDSGGAQLAEKTAVKLLGQLPLSAEIRLDADTGMPTVEKSPTSSITESYINIAKNMIEVLSKQPKRINIAMPSVKVEKD